MTPELLSGSLFVVLLGLAMIWFVLIKLLFRRLEREHPQRYEAMGRPSLFVRNNPAGVWATLRFLVAREHQGLKDSYLSKLSDVMLGVLAIYLALFSGLCFLLASF